MTSGSSEKRGIELRELFVPARIRREIRRLRWTPLFDETFYAAAAKLSTRTSNAAHFVRVGWRRGLNPSRYFDTAYYLRANPDVQRAGANPLIHYLDYGWREGRKPHRNFDPKTYVSEFLGAENSSTEPLTHAILYNREWLDARLPPPVGQNEHELVKNSGYFDEAYYRSMYPDVDASGGDPADHYLDYGWKDDRNPSAEFDTNFYVRSFPESAAGGRCPLLFHLETGLQRKYPTRFRDGITLPVDAPPDRDSGEPSAAVHVHAFFTEAFEEIAWGLKNIPFPFHLLVTVVTKADKQFVESVLRRIGCGTKSEVVVVPRRGRDLAPLLVAGRSLWSDYEFVCHLHTKRSLHTDFGDAWRRYLLDQLLASPAIVSNIFAAFARDPSIGMIFPDNYYMIKKFVDWEPEADSVTKFLSALGINNAKLRTPAKFAAGSMAWYRTQSLRAITARALTFDIFDEEGPKVGTTLAHALERMLPVAVEAAGYRVVPYYSTRRVPLVPGVMRHGAAPSDETVGTRWLRDSPKIASNRPQRLQPLSSIFNNTSLDIHWIIPDFGRGAGGHMTIFRIVELLGEFGHRQTIWVQNAHNHINPEICKKRLQEWYRPIQNDVIVRFLPDDTRQLSGDIIIATDCWTVYPAVTCANFKERLYFIQDFEPYFHPMGENYLVAEATYRMGLCALCAGDWLYAKARSYGMWARKWFLASDPEFYFPSHPKGSFVTEHQIIKIAFYARNNTPRRAVNLGIAAFDELAKRKLKFKVLLFGEEDLKITTEFDYELLGIQTPEQLGDLYRNVDIGVVFSTTNYSLVPLEMMACGLPVVEVDTESTRCVFKNGEATLVPADPNVVADQIERLINDDALRMRQIEAAYRFVEKYDWRESAKAVEAALFERLGELGFKAIDPVQICAPGLTSRSRASVVIPVLNGGDLFETVLDRLSRQTCEWPYDVLIIDNGSTDGTQDRVRRFTNRNVRLHEIPHSEFQHGRTRNLGIELTDGDFVALTTADATPADDRWLQNLIGGFSFSDRVAGVFGRHRAYPEHGPFIARDIDDMFDRYAEFPRVYSIAEGLPSHIYRGGLVWRMLMHFYSDNNSAISRAVWKYLPYPNIEWGEDQVWAWEMLKAGFEKAYVDDAVVYHSHDFSLAKTYQFAYTEGRFFREKFGYDIVGGQADQLIERLNSADEAYAMNKLIPRRQLELQRSKTQKIVLGRADGAASLG